MTKIHKVVRTVHEQQLHIVDVVRGRPKAKPKERKKTMTLSTIQRLAFCNSAQLPRRIVQDGVVKEWVGVGWISTEDKPKSTDVYVVED